MRSIDEKTPRHHTAAPEKHETGTRSPSRSDAEPGALLDITREIRRNAESDHAPLTQKQTPDKRFTDAEKAAWRARKVEETDARTRAALAVARWYVDAVPKGSPEYAARMSLFGSFLKCRKRHNGPVDLLEYPDGRLALAGVWRCRSKWICPDCSGRLMYAEAVRLRALLEAIQRENAERKGNKGSARRLVVMFVTLTAPHRPGEPLREQMRVFSSMFSHALHCSKIRALRSSLGFVGSVRAFDHTMKISDDGARDWHTHLHTLFVFDSDELAEGSEVFEKFKSELFKAWAHEVACAFSDGRTASEKAFSVELVDLEPNDEHDARAVADYAAKICALPGYLTKSAKEKQLDGERVGGLAPGDILDLYADTGAEEYAGAWVEYCEGTKGFHRLDFSKGLASRFGLRTEDDKAAARHVLPAEVACVAVGSPLVLDNVKKAIASGDITALEGVLAPYGVEYLAGDICRPQPLEMRPVTAAEGAEERFRRRMEKRRELFEKILDDLPAGVAQEVLAGLKEETLKREAAALAERPRKQFPRAYNWLADNPEELERQLAKQRARQKENELERLQGLGAVASARTS